MTCKDRIFLYFLRNVTMSTVFRVGNDSRHNSHLEIVLKSCKSILRCVLNQHHDGWIDIDYINSIEFFFTNFIIGKKELIGEIYIPHLKIREPTSQEIKIELQKVIQIFEEWKKSDEFLEFIAASVINE